MLGYVLIILATLCGNTKELAGKYSSRALDTLSHKLYFGAVRTSLCAILALCIWLCEGQFPRIGAMAIVISVLSGISQSVCMLSWIAAVRGGAYVRLGVFNQAGLVIPCILAASLLGETVSLWQYIALFVLVFAIALFNDKRAENKLQFSDMLLLLVVWLSSGMNSLTIKLYVRFGGASNSFFNLITFFVAAIAFCAAYLIFRKKGEKVSLPKVHYTLYVPVMVITLYLYTYLQAEAAKYLDAMIMFPLKTVLGLVVSAIIATVFLKEKLTLKSIFGIIIVSAAIVVINFC